MQYSFDISDTNDRFTISSAADASKVAAWFEKHRIAGQLIRSYFHEDGTVRPTGLSGQAAYEAWEERAHRITAFVDGDATAHVMILAAAAAAESPEAAIGFSVGLYYWSNSKKSA